MSDKRMKQTISCWLGCLTLAWCLSAGTIQGAIATYQTRKVCAPQVIGCYRSLYPSATLRAQDQAQPTPSTATNHPPATLRREFKSGLPIAVGEKLEYEVRYARFPLYATVGVVTFEYLGLSTGQASEPIKGLNIAFTPADKEQFFRFRARAVSKGVLLSLLGVEASDRFETLVDAADFSARLSFKEIDEGKKHVAQTSLFDRAAQTVNFTAHDLNKPAAPPRLKSLPRPDGMLDLLSAFYFLRLQKLKEGQLVRFPVNDNDTNYTFDIVVGPRVELKTDCGRVKTLKVEPQLFGPGQLFARQGEMTMWLSDDNRHIPLRLLAKTPAGTITAKLLNFKKNCQLLEPEDERQGDKEKRRQENKGPAR